MEMEARKIFVDLEMNPIPQKYGKEKSVCRLETIEFGAVMLDENNQEISSFCQYVRPVYCEKIYANIEKLTGISWEMVEAAAPFPEVLSRFSVWCGKPDYTVFSWSESDLLQLKQEGELKRVKVTDSLNYMYGHWKDFQKEYRALFPLDKIMSLENAIYLCGLDFKGRAHDGLNDARMTAELYRYVKDSDQFADLQRRIQELFTPTTFTLGDMIDISVLNLPKD